MDFSSRGSNVLFHFVYAVDRGNPILANRFDVLLVSLLRALRALAAQADAANVPITLCGEMASDPLFLPVLLALGFSELSMNAVVIPRVKHILRLLSFDDCELIFQDLKRFTSAQEGLERLKSFMVEKFPTEFNFENRT